MRLDKYLAKCGLGSRSKTRKLITNGKVLVNDMPLKNIRYHVKIAKDIIKYNNKILFYKEYVYIMLNKPKGYISANTDNLHQTVVDLVRENYLEFDLFPVGRLDKDTTGLLILTNNGKFMHKIISPKNHIAKCYQVTLRDVFLDKYVLKFTEGVMIDDYKCKPAIVETISDKVVKLTIYEGKYHQVKRMFKSLGNEVIELKRLSIGNLMLDENLKLAEYRELTSQELEKLNFL